MVSRFLCYSISSTTCYARAKEGTSVGLPRLIHKALISRLPSYGSGFLDSKTQSWMNIEIPVFFRAVCVSEVDTKH